MHRTSLLALLALGILPGSMPSLAAAAAPTAYEARLPERTPPRLSFVDGNVSFRRAGASDWAPASVNTPLAPGDELYTSAGANLEFEFGPRAFVRAGAETLLRFQNQEPDFFQFAIPTGHASLDLRELAPGHTVELDSPNAAFAIERTGYYRVDVVQAATTFIGRRGGRATVIPANGQPAAIAPSEQVVIEGTEVPRVETYVAPELDAWDRWNYARTDYLVDAVSSRYISPGIYGAETLDHYGSWRVVANYGAVWVPDTMPLGWAPYSTGAWLWDPSYGWTWVDDAPWGWVPFHYGRWAFIDGVWAWAPGPIVVRPVYAPALVAFFGGGIGPGGPPAAIGWVALGWGEPLIPWWGPARFVGVPWWAGWGGPRVVNNVVINRTTIVNVNNITIYRNASIRNALVVVPRDRLGRGPIQQARLTHPAPQHLAPVHGALPVKPVRASLVAAPGPAPRPPETAAPRVVTTRAPRDVPASLHAQGLEPSPTVSAPPSRLVPTPQRRPDAVVSARPPFGQLNGPERPRPPLPPRFEGQARAPQATAPPSPRPSVEARAKPERGQPVAPPPSARAPQVEAPRLAPRPLPGEPANRLFPGRLEPKPQRPEPQAKFEGAPRGAQEPGRRAGSPPGAGEPARPDSRQ